MAAHLYIENGVDWVVRTENPTMTNYMLAMVGQLENSSIGTPVKDSAGRIGGTTAVFGTGSTSSNACSAAASSSPAIWSAAATIANSSPATPFSATEVIQSRAYTNQSAATNGQAAYELINNNYYAIYLATGGKAVAKYNTTASSGNYWTLITTC